MTEMGPKYYCHVCKKTPVKKKNHECETCYCTGLKAEIGLEHKPEPLAHRWEI